MSRRSVYKHRKLALAQVAMRVIFWALWFNGLLGLLQDAATLPLPERISIHRNNTWEHRYSVGHWRHTEMLSSTDSTFVSNIAANHPPSDREYEIPVVQEENQPMVTPHSINNGTEGAFPTNSSSSWWIVVTLKGGSHNAAFIVSITFYGLSLLFAMIDLVVMTGEAGGSLCCLACCCCHSHSHSNKSGTPCATEGDMDSALTFSGQLPGQAGTGAPAGTTHSTNCCVCGTEGCSSCHCSVCSSSTDASDGDEDEETPFLSKPGSSIFHPFADEMNPTPRVGDYTPDDVSEEENEEAQSGQNSCCISVKRLLNVIRSSLEKTMWFICYTCGGGFCYRRIRSAQLEDGRNYPTEKSKRHHHHDHHKCCCHGIFSAATRMRLVAWIRCLMFLDCAVAVTVSSLFHWITLKGPHEPLCWLSLLVHLLSILALVACAPTAYCTSPSPAESPYRGNSDDDDGSRPGRFRSEFAATSEEEEEGVEEYHPTEEAEETESSTWNLNLGDSHPTARFHYPYLLSEDDEEDKFPKLTSYGSSCNPETERKPNAQSTSPSRASTFANPIKGKRIIRGSSHKHSEGKKAARESSRLGLFSSRDAFFSPPTVDESSLSRR